MAALRCYGCGGIGSTRYECKRCGHTSPMEHYHFTDEREDSNEEDAIMLIVEPNGHLRAEPSDRVVIHIHPHDGEGHKHPNLEVV